MNWTIQSYGTDTGNYLVTRRGDADWVLIVQGTQGVSDSFPDELSAMAYADEIDYENTFASQQLPVNPIDPSLPYVDPNPIPDTPVDPGNPVIPPIVPPGP
jgi:hypothetical protein